MVGYIAIRPIEPGFVAIVAPNLAPGPVEIYYWLSTGCMFPSSTCSY